MYIYYVHITGIYVCDPHITIHAYNIYICIHIYVTRTINPHLHWHEHFHGINDKYIMYIFIIIYICLYI